MSALEFTGLGEKLEGVHNEDPGGPPGEEMLQAARAPLLGPPVPSGPLKLILVTMVTSQGVWAEVWGWGGGGSYY